MDNILIEALEMENVKYTFTSSENFKAINISNAQVKKVKNILYVLCRNVVFVQPIGKNKSEILFN